MRELLEMTLPVATTRFYRKNIQHFKQFTASRSSVQPYALIWQPALRPQRHNGAATLKPQFGAWQKQNLPISPVAKNDPADKRLNQRFAAHRLLL